MLGMNVKSRPECSAVDCSRPHAAKGLCSMHYRRGRNRAVKSRQCSVKGCGNPHNAKGFCRLHYVRSERGIPLEQPLARDIPPKWRKNADGYIVRRVSTPEGRVTQWQHREVMAEVIGRPLLPEEEVHHKNSVRHDNRPENLELWTKSQPAGGRVEDKLKWAHELINLYERGS